MTILFLVAVLLAIPTTGLSLLAWLVLLFFVSRSKAKQRIAGLDQMRSTRVLLEPMIGGSSGEFFNAIDAPKAYGKKSTANTDEQCGRHVINFISHNPGLPEAFMQALKIHRLKGSTSLPTAIEALEAEKEWGGQGPMHYLCFTAISTLMQQNKLACFEAVDRLEVMAREQLMSLKYGGMIEQAS